MQGNLSQKGESPDRVRLQSSGGSAFCSGFGFRHEEEAGPSMDGDVNRCTRWYVLKASALHMKMGKLRIDRGECELWPLPEIRFKASCAGYGLAPCREWF